MAPECMAKASSLKVELECSFWKTDLIWETPSCWKVFRVPPPFWHPKPPKASCLSQRPAPSPASTPSSWVWCGVPSWWPLNLCLHRDPRGLWRSFIFRSPVRLSPLSRQRPAVVMFVSFCSSAEPVPAGFLMAVVGVWNIHAPVKTPHL